MHYHRDAERVMSRRQRKIEKVISSLRSCDPQKIIRFGPQARGDDDRYSDLDLAVIKETDERFLDRLETVYGLVRSDFALDALV
jgi:predicted nucleotidyltransferase